MPDTVNQKISELPSASSPGNSDVLAGVQSSTTKKFALSDLKTFFQNGLVPTSRKVNNKALSSDITLDKTDVGLGNVANVLQYSASNKPTSADVTYDGTTSGLSATDVKGAVDELASEKQEKITASGILKGDGAGGVSAAGAGTDYEAPVKTGTMALSLSWSGSGPYTQTVTVSGATISSNSKVDLQLTPAQIAQLITDGVEALVIENNAGTLTATAIGATPSTALTVQCTVTEVVA